ncbi:MAG TPA: hypothetical protein VKY85_26630 [Candidatus Angelobacter sp.]|jgi:hypothetical protein|nr:hypothetical protein [Candidatus Angelobacter sp.]
MEKTLQVEEVLHRVQQLTLDLKLVRGEICSHVFSATEPHGPSLFSTAAGSPEIMSQFKAAIDDLRHVVWLYLEAVGNRSTFDVDSQRRLLARATEIVYALSVRPPLPKPNSASERSFLERLLHLIENRTDLKPPGRIAPHSVTADAERQERVTAEKVHH